MPVAWTSVQVAKRAVQVETRPFAPRDLGDRKQILAALQKFGEVVTFRNLLVSHCIFFFFFFFFFFLGKANG